MGTLVTLSIFKVTVHLNFFLNPEVTQVTMLHGLHLIQYFPFIHVVSNFQVKPV